MPHNQLQPVQPAAGRHRSLLARVSAILGIASLVLPGLFFVLRTDISAAAANELSKKNAEKIEQKADREDVKDGLREINRKLDKLNDKVDLYLLHERKR